MNQNWVIALIEDKSKDIHHHLCRDGLLLGALHVDDILLDAIGPQEGRVGSIFNLSLNKSPTKTVSQSPVSPNEKIEAKSASEALPIIRTLPFSISNP
jgi:hypothetical protein